MTMVIVVVVVAMMVELLAARLLAHLHRCQHGLLAVKRPPQLGAAAHGCETQGNGGQLGLQGEVRAGGWEAGLKLPGNQPVDLMPGVGSPGKDANEGSMQCEEATRWTRYGGVQRGGRKDANVQHGGMRCSALLNSTG